MADVDAIEIIEYNSVNAISLNVPSEIDKINVAYTSDTPSITLDYTNEISNFELTIGENVQSVYSVNGLLGDVRLTYSEELGHVSPTAGVYSYNVEHNMDYSYPIVAIYNTDNQVVIGDISIVDSNNVTINSLIDLEGYTVVIQR